MLTPDSHLWAQEFYRGAPSPAHFVSMPDVGHVIWNSAGEETILTRGVYTALLLQRFKGVENLDDWLLNGSALSQSTFVDDVRSK